MTLADEQNRAWVDRVAELDEGIRYTVVALNVLGFDTTDSGDGKSKLPSEEALPYPHVFVKADPDKDPIDETDRLYRYLIRIGVEIHPVGEGDPFIQLTYDPANPDCSIIMLSGLDDEGLPDVVRASSRHLVAHRRIKHGLEP